MTSQAYLSDLFSLDGRVAVVTGGSSGIGRAIARALAYAGARVLVVARREAELAATVGELAADGRSAAWVSDDLSTRDGLRTAAEEAAEAFGEPDILVNCAGVNLRPTMGELDEDVWDTTMAVNLEAPYLLGQRFGPGMAERGFGRIIHINLPAGASGVRAERRLRRLQGGVGVAGPFTGRGMVAVLRHLQHARAGVRDDAAQRTAVV